MSKTTVKTARKKRRLLSPSQKYEVFVAVLTGQSTQREAAENLGCGPRVRGMLNVRKLPQPQKMFASDGPESVRSDG